MKEMEKGLVSVIVPVYNVSQYIEECVNSITSQTYSNLEIIIVDDGSTDDSGIKCDLFAKSDSRIVVIHKENGGLSSARNAAIDIMTGEYVFFVDSDDFLDKDTVLQHIEAIESNSVEMVIGTSIEFYKDIVIPQKEFSPYICSQKEILKKLLMNDNLDHGIHGVIYKSYLFDDIRFPLGLLYEDFATTYYLVEKCDKIMLIDDRGYFYRVRPESIMTSKVSKKNMTLLDTAEKVCNDVKCKYPDLEIPVLRKMAITYMNLYFEILKVGFNSFGQEQSIIQKFLIDNKEQFFRANEISRKEKIKYRMAVSNKITYYIACWIRVFLRRIRNVKE